tara:strand:+ start:1643 stop:2065 length:423 start_codon:yes stop_codon:yes gene_type:complete
MLNLNMVDSKDIVNLTENKSVDLSHLDEESKKEIHKLIAKQKVELTKKGMEQSIDVDSLRARLNTFGNQVYDVIDKGGSITITNAKDDSIGRTEVIMGNTDEAAKGKLSRSAKGLPDNSKWLIIGGVVVAIIAIFALSGS